MRKDFDLILSKSADLDIEMPATLAASECNAEAVRGGDADFSAVIRSMEQKAEPSNAIDK
jgi:3-hydroxyisobutyrate dehydrogenase-like beta-hydroxyacid dehydrogenase